MKTKFKKGDKISIKDRFAEMRQLLRPFIKKYNEPILVHATPNIETFKKILKEKRIKVPSKTRRIEHAYIERMLGIYPCIFLSMGFAYASSYDFKYSLIFNLNYLKNSNFYKNSLSYQSYKAIVLYWNKHNPEYLERLAKKNQTCKQVVYKFYNEKYHGKTKKLFDFWKCEKETFDLFNKYPKKKEVLRIIAKIINEKFVKYPNSIKWAKKEYLGENVPEVIIKKDISLVNNVNFVGFYIRGKIPKEILQVLKKKYPSKILFDGKEIKQLGNVI